MKKIRYGEKAITLIALVITIIVLLILAGVSIATLTGDNGIITNASKSNKETEIANAKEQAKIDIMAWQTEELAKGNDVALNDAKVKEIIEKANENASKKYYKELTATGF